MPFLSGEFIRILWNPFIYLKEKIVLDKYLKENMKKPTAYSMRVTTVVEHALGGRCLALSMA